MKRFLKMAIVGAFVALAGCSQTQLQTGFRNVSAADCSTPQAQQAFINNLPPNPFINGQQEVALMSQLCIAEFGTVSAPAAAPGMAPMIPAPAPSVSMSAHIPASK